VVVSLRSHPALHERDWQRKKADPHLGESGQPPRMSFLLSLLLPFLPLDISATGKAGSLTQQLQPIRLILMLEHFDPNDEIPCLS
jgi:hypothetical protein